MNQGDACFGKTCESKTELLEGRSRGQEVWPKHSNPLAAVATALRTKPVKLCATVHIPYVALPCLRRSEHLAELRIYRNIRPDGREQVLSIQNTPFHQERSKLLLHNLGRLLAR